MQSPRKSIWDPPGTLQEPPDPPPIPLRPLRSPQHPSGTFWDPQIPSGFPQMPLKPLLDPPRSLWDPPLIPGRRRRCPRAPRGGPTGTRPSRPGSDCRPSSRNREQRPGRGSTGIHWGLLRPSHSPGTPPPSRNAEQRPEKGSAGIHPQPWIPSPPSRILPQS